jgi:hypothetical protein
MLIHLIERYTTMRAAMDIFPPYSYPEVLAELISLGHFGRRIRRMRQLCGERRRVLIQSLDQEFGEHREVHETEAGMYLTIALPEGLNDVEIGQRRLQRDSGRRRSHRLISEGRLGTDSFLALEVHPQNRYIVLTNYLLASIAPE